MDHKGIGFLVLRAFFAQFWLLQFFGKLRDQESGIVAWRNLGIWAEHTTTWFERGTPLPRWLVLPYTTLVPYLELLLGVMLLVGLLTRQTLIAAALLLVSLDAGLMLQLKHDVVAANTITLLAILVALVWEPHGRGWSLDEVRRRRAAA